MLITCPGCRTPLRVPGPAVGTEVGCPHCRARLTPAADGSARPVRRLPGRLFAPAGGLLLVGLAGVLVNGYLAALTSLKPGAGLEAARGMVTQQRLFEGIASAGRNPTEYPYPAHAAAAGVAAATRTRDAQDELLAQAQAAGLGRRAWQFLPISLVALAGGACMLAGRLLPLAAVGCLAAAVNVNHMCFVPGVLVGVYGLLTLARDDVRPYFRRPHGPQEPRPRGSG